VSSQTANDAAARRRALIGRCAARTAGLDGAPAQRFAGYVRDGLLLSPRPQARGTARPLEQGIRLGSLRQLAPWLLGPVLLSAFTAFSIADFWIQSILIAVLLLTIGLAPRFAVVSNWRNRLRGASSMLPEAGAPIRADSEHLTVGAITVPWSDVRLEAVDVRWVPLGYWINPRYRVAQLRLATGTGSLVLDVRLIENGREVIDTICGHLV
jgi:hypothetical protein